MTGYDLGNLIDGHAAALVLFARQWTVAPEDVVQDALIKLAGQLPRPDDPVAWLYRAVRNRAIDTGKADKRRTARESAVARPVRWFAEVAIDDLDATTAMAALEDLPGDQREAIVARLWGGMTLQQVALVAGCSISTAARRFEAGIAALRVRLGEPRSEKVR